MSRKVPVWLLALIPAAALLLAAGAAVVGVAMYATRDDRPRAEVEGERWSVDELIAYLKKREPEFKVVSAPDGPEGKAVYLVVPTEFDEDRPFDPGDLPFRQWFHTVGVMYVERRATPLSAEKLAAKWYAQGSWNWGRFFIAGKAVGGRGERIHLGKTVGGSLRR